MISTERQYKRAATLATIGFAVLVASLKCASNIQEENRERVFGDRLTGPGYEIALSGLAPDTLRITGYGSWTHLGDLFRGGSFSAGSMERGVKRAEACGPIIYQEVAGISKDMSITYVIVPGSGNCFERS